MDDSARAMHVFVKKALTRIHDDAGRRHGAVRAMCADVLAWMRERGYGEAAATSEAHEHDDAAVGAITAVYLGPLQLACESAHPRLVEHALSCVHKLVAYGFVPPAAQPHPPPGSVGALPAAARAAKGGGAGAPAGEDGAEPSPAAPAPAGPASLCARVIEVVCACKDVDEEAPQLCVVKVALAAVTAPKCGVHDTTLLLAVKTCYHLHLVGASDGVRRAAYGGLTQMLHAVFARVDFGARPGAGGAVLPGSASAGALSARDGFASPAALATPLMACRHRALSAADSASAAPTAEGAPACAGEGGGALVVDVGAAASGPPSEPSESSRSQPSAASVPPDADPAAAAAVRAGAAAAAARAGGGAGGGADGSEAGGGERALLSGGGAVSVAQRDAFLVLRALCKLSMKPLPDDVAGGAGGDGVLDEDSIDLRSKLLSLTLLVDILRTSGLQFRRGERFLGAVKQYLCVSLAKNGVCPVVRVLQLSLQLFLCVLHHFRDHLKNEVGVVYGNVLLLLLESPHSSVGQKGATLGCVREVVRSPQLLVDVFVNYDCDVEGASLYARTAAALSKLAQLPPGAGHAEPGVSAPEHDALRRGAVRALVSMAASLSRWADGARDRGAAVSAAATMPALEAVDAAAAATDDDSSAHARHDGRRAAAAASRRGSHGELPPYDAAQLAAEADAAVAAEAAAAGAPNGAEAGGALVAAASVAPAQFEAALQYKRELHMGIARFNLKPKKGLEYLRATNHIEWSPQGVAHFLQSTAGLDKSQVGDYLGEPDEFNRAVLYAYVDALDFTGMHFDDGIRHFLAGFRLPGEAQKIDRMMEKFAARYCQNNPGLFESADTAYVLAYSLIMLNTDAHSAQIKVKMTVEQFVRNNRGINGSDDLPTDFLELLYARIVNNEIKMKDEGPPPELAAGGALGGRRRKEAAWSHEVQRSVQRSQELFKAKSKKRVAYYSAHHAATVVPMFEQLWCPLLAALSVFLEEADRLPASDGSADGGADEPPRGRADEGGGGSAEAEGADGLGGGGGAHGDGGDEGACRAALDGIGHALHLACIGGLHTPQAAFLAALVKFTRLDADERLHPRHVHAVKVLVALALREGNTLGAGWAPVLKCVSELHRLSLLAEGSASDADVLAVGARAGSRASDARALRQWGALAAPHITQQTRLRHRAPHDGGGGGGGGGAAAADGGGGGEARELELHNARVVHGALSSHAFLSDLDSALAEGALQGAGALGPGGVRGGGGAHAHANGGRSLAEGHLALDRIFSASAELDADAVVDFVVNLCAVSAEELLDPSSPRIFSLQKIVEVAYYNMARIRLVWSRIWGVLGPHFGAVGCHPHLGVAMYAVDSLKQLANSFLEREEHALYAFQSAFLRPFEAVMGAHAEPRMRELVVACVRHLIQTRGGRIRSGWRTLFAVLSAAAADEDAAIVELGWAVCAEVVAVGGGRMGAVCEGAAYLEAVGCVRAYVAQAEAPTAAAAALVALGAELPAQLLAGALPYPEGLEADGAQLLHGGAATAEGGGGGGGSAQQQPPPAHQRALELPPAASLLPPHQLRAPAAAAAASGGGAADSPPPPPPASSAVVGAASAADALWWPLLAALTQLLRPPRDVGTRDAALGALIELLRAHGIGCLSEAAWGALVSQLLLPLYEEPRPAHAAAEAARGPGGGAGEAAPAGAAVDDAAAALEALAVADAADAAAAAREAHAVWVCSTGLKLLQRLLGLFIAHAGALQPLTLPLVRWLLRCVACAQPQLVHAAAECLAAMLVACTPELPARTWSEVVAALTTAVETARAAEEADAAADAAAAGGAAAARAAAPVRAGLPGGLPSFLLGCACEVVEGLRASLAPDVLLGLLELLRTNAEHAARARDACAQALSLGGGRPSQAAMHRLGSLCDAEAAAVGAYWRATLALYVPHVAPAEAGAVGRLSVERQRSEQQAALLDSVCGLEGRVRDTLARVLHGYAAAVALTAGSAASEHPAVAARHAEAVARLVCARLAPLAVLLLRGVLSLTDAQFVLHLPRLYPRLVELMGCEDRAVRTAMHDVFEQRSAIFVGAAEQRGSAA